MSNLAELPAPFGNGLLHCLLPGVHYIEGTARMKPFFSFPRTMVVLSTNPGSSANELVVVNAVRLDEAQEAELLKLGTVVAVVRIGIHDQDTAYYVRKFGAKVYGYTTVEYQNGVQPDYDLSAGHLPAVPDLKVIHFSHLPAKYAECALHISDKVLITCDSIQEHSEARGNFLTRLIMPRMGFRGSGIVGPFWKKTVEEELGEDKGAIREDLMQIKELEFLFLLTGHGVLVDEEREAKKNVSESLDRAFP